MNEASYTVLIIGSVDFALRIRAAISAEPAGGSELPRALVSGLPSEAWGLCLTHRPHHLVVEIGPRHQARDQQSLRRLLTMIRERFNRDVFITVALAACEKFSFGGDLLFAENGSLQSSGWVDTFVVQPPGGLPGMVGLGTQIARADTFVRDEMVRRARGEPKVPALGSPGWVQSLADPKSRELWMRWLPRYASYTNENPIIIGETGTGKTNLALALHQFSRRPGQFISITPRDFSSSELVQAELFGAVAGAYTGAVDKWGLVKRAEKGTLFIDELQSIDKELQGKLITFIENKTYRRVGSADSIEADVRFVFASNRTLYDMMQRDVLRDDFAYRLERVQLELSPLHERRLDIAAALAYALAKVRRQRPHAGAIIGFSTTAYRILFSQAWPGNLRQLENTVAQLCERSEISGEAIISERTVYEIIKNRLAKTIITGPEVLASAFSAVAVEALTTGVSSLQEGIEKVKVVARTAALQVAEGDPSRAAALVGDDPATLQLMSTATDAIVDGAKRKDSVV